MTTLYTLPTIPLHFILRDDEGNYWFIPATMTGQPRSPYVGSTKTLEAVPPQVSRVLLASWAAYPKPT